MCYAQLTASRSFTSSEDKIYLDSATGWVIKLFYTLSSAVALLKENFYMAVTSWQQTNW